MFGIGRSKIVMPRDLGIAGAELFAESGRRQWPTLLVHLAQLLLKFQNQALDAPYDLLRRLARSLLAQTLRAAIVSWFIGRAILDLLLWPRTFGCRGDV